MKPEDLKKRILSRQLTPDLEGQEAIVCGWVSHTRDLGGIRFIVIRDKYGEIQVTLPKGKVNEELFNLADKLGMEWVVAVKGVVKNEKRAPQGAEIIPEEIEILNRAISQLPLDPTGRISADLDTRLNARIMDLRRPQTQAIFKINHHLLRFIREYLIKEDFIEINTPKIIATATEGGTELFPLAYFEKEAFLAQSPQLYKEQLSSVFERVFEIAPIWRAEMHNTTRHLNELIMVDIEMAYGNMYDVMEVLENMIKYAFEGTSRECQKELKILNQKIEVPKTPFPRYTYDEVLKMLENKMEISWGEDIGTEACKILGELLNGFYFIIEWPSTSKPFYIKIKEDDPRVSESFDLNFDWLEICSGGTRVHDKEKLISRLSEQGLNPSSFKFHLQTFDYGMPPHAGFGLGLARLLMIITGMSNIRECVLFPRDRTRLTP